MTIAWPLTARDHITLALKQNAILAGGEEPTSDELADCQTILNGVLKSWSVRASAWWREDTASKVVSAGAEYLDLDAEVAEVVSVRLIQSATYERPLEAWGRADYQDLPNKAATGSPVAFYLSRSNSAAKLYLWPRPSITTTILLDYLRMPDTITDASQAVDIPEEYQETVYANLGVRCAGLFNKEPNAELVVRARDLEQMMLDSSRPDSYFMGPWSA